MNKVYVTWNIPQTLNPSDDCANQINFYIIEISPTPLYLPQYPGLTNSLLLFYYKLSIFAFISSFWIDSFFIIFYSNSY